MSHHILVIVLVLASALGLTPAAAESSTGAYAAPTTPLISPFGSVAGQNVGGVKFAPGPGTPVAVDIADRSGASVPYTVCQDTDEDGICGEEGEPVVEGCGTGVSLADAPAPFSADHPVTVFVRAADLACDGRATSGSVTLTYA